MSFWRYCERVEGLVGQTLVVKHIETVWSDWAHNNSVGECAAWIEKLEKATKK